MNAFVPNGGWVDESQIISRLLTSKRFRLRFPDYLLEKQFRDSNRDRAVASIRSNTWLIIAIYVLAMAVSYAQLVLFAKPEFVSHDFQVWLTVISVGAFAALSTIACAVLPKQDLNYWTYITVAGVAGISGITIASASFMDPYLNQNSSYVVVLVVLLIYGVANLRMSHALTITLIGGSISLATIFGLGLRHDWGHFGQYFIMANLIGIATCYVLEQRDRVMFLQGRMLELEKQQLNVLTQRLDQLSREDALTGLANRRHFNESLHREWERSRREQQPISLVFIDVDHFKPYNDAHGHLDGDHALAAVGSALRASIRRSCDLAARYGGEEFVLLLPNTSKEGALEVAHNVIKSIDDLGIPHLASPVAKHVTASVGVATEVPSGGRSASFLVANADVAVYQAKESGRHCIKVHDAE